MDYVAFYRDYQVVSVNEGNDVAKRILDRQLEVHRLMNKTSSNSEWEALSDEHYELRKIRHRILNDTGRLALRIKRDKSNV